LKIFAEKYERLYEKTFLSKEPVLPKRGSSEPKKATEEVKPTKYGLKNLEELLNNDNEDDSDELLRLVSRPTTIIKIPVSRRSSIGFKANNVVLDRMAAQRSQSQSKRKTFGNFLYKKDPHENKFHSTPTFVNHRSRDYKFGLDGKP